MVSPLFFYQLTLIALIWLCVMLHWVWPSDAAACPTLPEPLPPRPKRKREPTQGDRILNCSGEHRQQVVFIKTTEKSFLPQAHLASTFLPQKIESNMPHRSYIFGGLVLPDTTAIFIERDI